MQLIKINKTRYRKHLNIVIISFIATLLVLSLVFGSILIHLFSDIDLTTITQVTDTQVTDVQITNELTEQVGIVPESNFKYNLFGVILSLLVCLLTLQALKKKNFFIEIYYVWQLKQIHNSIFRKLKKIKKGIKNDENNAFIILNFYYHSLKQIYMLDDNTLTISSVEKNITELNKTIESKSLVIELEQFDKSLLVVYG